MTDNPNRYKVPEDIQLNPANGVPLVQQIRSRYSRLITSGHLEAGTLLPSVRKLAEHLQVNVNTVRLAYQRLESDGLVKVSQGVGARVLALDLNRLMRLARSEHSNTVGVIVPDVGNPFYAAFLRGVEEAAQAKQSMLLVCSTHDDLPTLLRSFAQLSAHHIDGIIAASCNLCEILPQESEQPANLPVVSADWPACKSFSVQMDLENAGYQATRHLIEHGHQRIGIVTLTRGSANIRPVNQGYERALKEAGIAPDPALIARVTRFDMEAGWEGTQALLLATKRPTAIFAIADTLALGVMQAVRAAGLRVPEDIALTSFNDIAFASLTAPALTTVSAPAQDLGREAMKMLNSLLAGKQPPKREVILPTSLIIRQSCGSHEPHST